MPLMDFFPQLSKRYGPVFTVWLGTKPMAVICGIESVKDALITHSEEFGGRPPVPILDQVTKGFGEFTDYFHFDLRCSFQFLKK